MFTCPYCERPLRSTNQWHNCVKVSIDSLFEGKAEETIFVFDKLLSTVIDWEGVTVSATKNCIVFVHHQTFLIIKPMKKLLDLKFYSSKQLEDDLILKSVYYSGRYENHIRLALLEDLKPIVFHYIQQSYQLL